MGPHKVPPTLTTKLRNEWVSAVGASQAAEAASRVARELFAAYQNRLSSYLEMAGLDPNAKYQLNFDTGELSLVGAEDNAVQANGAAAASNGHDPRAAHLDHVP